MPIVRARTGAVAYEEQGAGTPLVLLLYDRYDPAIEKQDGHNAQAAIAHAQLVVLPTGHEPFAEDLEAFLQVLEPFLQAISVQRNFYGTSDSSSSD